MNWSFYALVLGFCIDLLLGDPHGFPHPVVLIGKLIDALGRLFRALLPKTKSGEIAAGALLWVCGRLNRNSGTAADLCAKNFRLAAAGA